MLKCSQFGGETAKGEPCQRRAGWGRDTSTGPCKYHHQRRPRRDADEDEDAPAPEPPAVLSADAQRVWRAMLERWVLGEEELLTLRGGLESWDLYQQARATLRQDGPVVETDGGAPKRHPAALVARDAFRDYQAAMRELGLSTEE